MLRDFLKIEITEKYPIIPAGMTWRFTSVQDILQMPDMFTKTFQTEGLFKDKINPKTSSNQIVQIQTLNKFQVQIVSGEEYQIKKIEGAKIKVYDKNDVVYLGIVVSVEIEEISAHLTNYKVIFRDATDDNLQVSQFLQSYYLRNKSTLVYATLNFAANFTFYSMQFEAADVNKTTKHQFIIPQVNTFTEELALNDYCTILAFNPLNVERNVTGQIKAITADFITIEYTTTETFISDWVQFYFSKTNALTGSFYTKLVPIDGVVKMNVSKIESDNKSYTGKVRQYDSLECRFYLSNKELKIFKKIVNKVTFTLVSNSVSYLQADEIIYKEQSNDGMIDCNIIDISFPINPLEI